MDLLAEDLRGLLDALGVTQVVLAGFSMGGYAAFAFYRKYKERVRALVLADTRCQPDTPQAAQGRETLAQRAEREGPAPIAETLLPRLLTQATLRHRPGTVEYVRSMIMRTSVAGIAGDLRGMALRPDSTETLGQIACPTLILVGEEDVLTPPADSEMMAQNIRGAYLQVIPEAAHLSPLENPDTFNFALLSFLEGL
jgi:pimeloyl-ACP methyl ester carboxylesterase